MDKFIQWLIETLLRLFGPPDVDDEQAFRDYCRQIVGFLEQIAKLTPTQVDDKIVATLQTLVVNDQYWAAFYAIIVALFGDGVVDAKQLTAAHREKVEALASQMGIPWPLLIQAIMLLLQLLFKGRG